MGKIIKKCIAGFIIGGILGFILGLIVMLIAFPFLFPPQLVADNNEELTQFYEEDNRESNNEINTETNRDASSSQIIEEENKNDSDSFTSEVVEEEKEEEKPTVLKAGEFNPDAEDSDGAHRGWGEIEIVEYQGENTLVFGNDVRLTPGPDYIVYLLTESGIETDRGFEEIKSQSVSLGSVKAFEGIQTYKIPDNVDIDDIQSVLVWCESFGVFITSGDIN